MECIHQWAVQWRNRWELDDEGSDEKTREDIYNILLRFMYQLLQWIPPNWDTEHHLRGEEAPRQGALRREQEDCVKQKQQEDNKELIKELFLLVLSVSHM